MNWNKRPEYNFLALCIILLLSCGIEDVIYLEPVEYAYVTGVDKGYVNLPDNDSNEYFRYYMIYYRIYTSNFLASNIDPSIPQNLRDINPALESDYNSLNYYITNENSSTSGMNAIFESRNYYQLYASDEINVISMNNLLSPPGYYPYPGASYGLMLNFDFTDSSSGPFMIMGPITSVKFYLLRSNKFTPIPADRLFFLNNELIINVNASANTNLDVNLFSNGASSYAYASFYIIACGIDNNFSTIYSRPKHIGIFRLPQK